MKKITILLILLLTTGVAISQTQIGSDLDSGTFKEFHYGTSTSISADGSIMAIGATGGEANGRATGYVQMFQNTAGTWTQIGADIDGEASFDFFGAATSLSDDGSIVAVGAIGNDGNGTGSGHVRVYQNIAGSWVQVGTDIDGVAIGDRSGKSVSLSGDGSIVAIGADNNNVRVYQNVAGTWTLVGASSNGISGTSKANSVSLSSDGSIVAIGRPNGSVFGPTQVFQNIAGTWTQIGADINGEIGFESSGFSVSLSDDGSIVAIGSPGNDGANGFNSGHVRVFKNLAGVWTQIGNDIDGEAAFDGSGDSVSLSADGSIVAIGAIDNGGGVGHVRVYQNIAGTWTQVGTDIDGKAGFKGFGTSVSLSANGSVAAIGAGRDFLGYARAYSIPVAAPCTLSISCSTHITVDTDPGVCTANVTYAIPIITDSCGVATVVQTIGLPPGSDFPIGTSTIEYLVTDDSGLTSICSFTINVNDNEAPVAVCQNITIQLDASGNATITAADLDGGSSDNCNIASIVIGQDSFDCSNIGLNGVTFLVTDDSGNTADCVAFVTVEDNTAPSAVCQDITIQLDALGMASINASDVDGGSTDACGLDVNSLSIDIDSFDCSNLGANTVTLAVTDDQGNSSSCTATVTVEDVTPPTAMCSNLTIVLDAAGTASITAADIDNGSSDGCSAVIVSVSPTSFDCDDLGANTVTLTVTDADGNSSSCTATVTVEDNIDPVFDSGTLPGNQERMADANGEYVLEDFTTGVTVTDNCSVTEAVIIIGQDPAIGTVLTVGVYDITLTATDDLGNDVGYVFELEVTEFLGVTDNQSLSSLAMYPNPASDFIKLSNPQNIELQQVVIYDLMGRLIQIINLTDMGTEKTIDVSNLSSATYMVLIQGTNSQITKQLIKK